MTPRTLSILSILGFSSSIKALYFIICSYFGRNKFLFSLFGNPFYVRGNKKKLGIDGYIYAQREKYERKLQQLLNIKTGVFLDIGANYGFWTRYVLFDTEQRGVSNCHVIAFEPFKQNFELLQKNISFLPHKMSCRALCVPLAVGRKDGGGFMSESNDDPGSTFVTDEGNHEIRITSLDSFCMLNSIENVSFIKIDVEGYEFAVLKGGYNIILRDKPCVACEIIKRYLSRNGTTPEQIFDFFLSLGYMVMYINEKGEPVRCDSFQDDGNYYFEPASANEPIAAD